MSAPGDMPPAGWVPNGDDCDDADPNTYVAKYANAVAMSTKGMGVDYASNPVKVVFYVADPAAVVERIRAEGGSIDMEATALELLNGTVVALGRDPDGYVVELVGNR